MTAVQPIRALASPYLFALICGLPLTDFMQMGVVAFNAGPIMGDIGATPEEYSLVATIYAAVAIGMIFNHRWLLERFGWRRLMVWSCASMAVGTLCCATSWSLTQFAFARVLMALGTSSFFTAGRVLVNHIPPSPKRFVAIKFIASGVAWGVVLGPLIASIAYSHGSWRYAFYALLVPACALCLLSWRALPTERPMPTASPEPLPVLLLIGGSLLLLYALQRSNFAFFAEPGSFAIVLLAALALTASAIWITKSKERPLLAFRALVQTRFLLSLTIFLICYLLLGATNTVIPQLLRNLQLPLVSVDQTIGVGALGGVAAWIVLARLLPRAQGPTRYYLASFTLLAICAVSLGKVSESAHPIRDVVPGLLANGAFVICALSTTAMQAFQTLQHDETVFTNANQVKNMLSQIGTALGITLGTLLIQWRSAFHQTRLVEFVAPTSASLQQTLGALAPHLSTSVGPNVAFPASMAQVGALVSQEATLLAVLDYFEVLLRFSLLAILIVLLERAWRWWSKPKTAAAKAPISGR